MNIRASELAGMVDHTLLKPEATPEQIDRLCAEGVEYGFAGMCVNPMYVARAAERVSALAGADGRRPPAVVSVAGFPLGASRTESKADEARRAMDDGATELDMVIPVGALIAGDRSAVRRDIETVARVVHPAGGILKVILETAALTDEQITLGCRLCAEGEADFVKTSTGFHPAGGATVAHVRLLHRLATPLKVKASGGIRTLSDAIAMMEAGAARIGTSSGVAIVDDLRRRSG